MGTWLWDTYSVCAMLSIIHKGNLVCISNEQCLRIDMGAENETQLHLFFWGEQ
jgi:hypothetical protein